MGRPSKYSPEIIDAICNKIATSGKGLKSICESNKYFPAFSTVFQWLNDPEKKEFADKYTRAREAQAELLADEIIEIADDSGNDIIVNKDGERIVDYENINRSRLRVDARKWKASKLAPKKFGDKMEVEQSGIVKITIMPMDTEEDVG